MRRRVSGRISYIAALAGLLVYAHLRRMLPLLFFFDTLVAGFLVTIPVIVWSYAAVGFTQPLADPQLVGDGHVAGL